jgi:hypothetical protein
MTYHFEKFSTAQQQAWLRGYQGVGLWVLNALLLLLAACSNGKEQESSAATTGFRLSQENNALSIGWGGKTRLSGGSPAFEGESFRVTGRGGKRAGRRFQVHRGFGQTTGRNQN